jgi:hypothetical protein
MRRLSWVAVALCAGCITPAPEPTPYQAVGTTRAGGYDDAQIAPGVFRILVYGNGMTSVATVNDYAARRAQELCDGAGFPRWRFARGGVERQQEVYGDEYGVETITKPEADYTVACMTDDEYQRSQSQARARLLGVAPSAPTEEDRRAVDAAIAKSERELHVLGYGPQAASDAGVGAEWGAYPKRHVVTPGSSQSSVGPSDDADAGLGDSR